jgi:DHA2 family multidrug resistance protein
VAALGLYEMSGLNLDVDFYAAALPRFIQGIGMGLFFVPLAAATFVGVRNEQMGNASGIFNLLRNLGGSFGVAFSTTVLAQRAQAHQNMLVEHVTPYNPHLQRVYDQVHAWLQFNWPQIPANQGTLEFLYREVLRQASVMAFNDTFLLLSLATAVLLPFTLLFRKAKPGAPH